MWLAALALLAPLAQSSASSDITDEQAIEAFVDTAKDKKAMPGLLLVGVTDLEKRYAASADRAAIALERLEAKQGTASEWKKIVKAEDKMQEALAKAVWASFRYRKDVTDQHMQIWRRAIVAFGQMPAHGADYLWEAFEDKRFRRDGGFRGRCVEEIGRTQDYKYSEDLIDLLDFHLIDVVTGVGKGFLFYKDAPGKVRRECTEKLVRAVESYRSKGQGGEDINGPRVWGKVKSPLMGALRALTGKNHSTSLDWTKFWNAYKNDKKLWKDD
jgi:hypothetical protein